MTKEELYNKWQEELSKPIQFGKDEAAKILYEVLNELDESQECYILETENHIKCSNCNNHFDLFKWVNSQFIDHKVNYCPNCGAKIKRGDK
jgi:DNA-directed RNA polymerase subunit RPC12/RpoP